jgi:putative ATPase
MSDLFADAARGRLTEVAPLAMRLRPRSLDEFVGQEHVLGPHSALRLAIEADRVGSMILYGPPGTGKTTLARIVAQTTGAEFEELSAVSASVADVRGVMTRARDRLGGSGSRTILFLDEIHRFNKAQQDALLPAVEEGLITLIGSTTENPYFEVNAALLSRCQVYELEPLSEEQLAVVVRRGAADLEVEIEIEDELVTRIAERAGGDARTALNILELTAQTAEAEGVTISEAHVEDASRKRPLVYDKTGDAHYDFISAFIKSMRGSDPDASVYYLAAMLESGEDARFIARRMIVLASEDIGNADPRALLVAVAAAQAVEHVGLPEARLNLAQAAIYLARAPKSNASYKALGAATRDVREGGNLKPPKALQSGGYPLAKKRLGKGQGYIYPHDDPAGFEVDYLPDELKGTTYYNPSGSGEESK